MANSTPLILVLGATGKTGSRVANILTTRGLAVRTAARSGADVRFDWDEPGTYAPALEGIAHVDLDRDAWVAGAVAGGIPAEYGAVLRMLTETIDSGHGSRPNDDVEKATGVAPTSFADFARRTATSWAVEMSR
jgi:nucleoside-diphosphate-sugar epimerase